MEDILASIRRILNEEETPATAEPPGETSADDDVLVLDQSMMVAAAEPAADMFDTDPTPEPRQPDPETEARQEPPVEVVALPQAAPPPPPVEAAAPPAAPTPDLVGAEAAAAAALSVGSLVRTLTAGRATQVYSGGPTLEDMVRAELRPLLKDWLDTHLPPMVERLVRMEIERVVGRAVP